MNFIISEEKIAGEIQQIKESSPKNFVVYNRIIGYLRNILENYKVELRTRGFRNIEEEIKFFKVVKQIPQSQLIFYLQLRNFELVFPVEQIMRKTEVFKKLEEINQFFIGHLEFCKYLELEQEYLDEYYFTRKFVERNELSTQQTYFIDREFYTSHDVVLSEINANHMILEYLQTEKRRLEHSAQLPVEKSNLEWTDSKAALTELIYALHTNGSINKGKIDLISIASVFEGIFNVKLDNIYKTYSEIKSRKTGRTKFLNELTWKFEQKLNKEEGI